MAFVNEKKHSRTIDHKRGFVLESKGGAREDAIDREEFELSLNEEKIRILTQLRTERDNKGQLTIFRSVIRFDPVETDHCTEEMIFSIITEALEEYGMLHDKSQAQKIIVTRTKEPVQWLSM